MQLKNILDSIDSDSIEVRESPPKKEGTIWLTEKQKEIVSLEGFNNICKWFFDDALQNFYEKKRQKE